MSFFFAKEFSEMSDDINGLIFFYCAKILVFTHKMIFLDFILYEMRNYCYKLG
jgi:hypothetical protein